MDLESVRILDNAGLPNEAIEIVRSCDPIPLSLSEEDIDFVGSLFKRAIKIRRSSWRIILEEEALHISVGNTRIVNLCKFGREVVEEEYVDLVNEALKFVRSRLNQSGDLQTHAHVLLLKLTGDFMRYMVEVYTTGALPRPHALEETVAECKSAYEEAQKLCAAHEMDPIDPLVLGLNLNHSVFTHEVLKRPKQACLMAKQAFDKAISKLGPLAMSESRTTVGEKIDERVVTLMKLMRDNLVRWTS